MSGQLTTHVLDTMHGIPAAHVSIQLSRFSPFDHRYQLLKTVVTTSQGRTEQPLLSADEMLPGAYELLFDAQAYFASFSLDLPDPPFLTLVPIRFNIVDADGKYHVPLLISPWAYSTYRGS